MHRLEQKLKMKPNLSFNLYQQIRLLSLSQDEYHAYLQKEIELNPVFELGHVREKNSFSLMLDSFSSCCQEESELEKMKQEVRLIFSDLLEQDLAYQIIDHTDHRGLLDIKKYGFLLEKPFFDRVIFKLKQVAPVGCFSFSYRDYFLTVLKESGKQDLLLYRILEEAFDIFLHQKKKALQELFKISFEQIEKTYEDFKNLKWLDLSQDRETSCFMNPDLMMNYEGGWSVCINRFEQPSLSIDPSYLNAYGQQPPFIKKKIMEAYRLRWMVEKREKALIMVGEELIKHNASFFLGDQPLFKRVDVGSLAKKMGVHLSTLYRIIKGKSLLSPIGLFPIDKFFSRKITSQGLNSELAHHIRMIIQQGGREKSYSDREIARWLSDQGFHLSRRGVNKYRHLLGINKKNP